MHIYIVSMRKTTPMSFKTHIELNQFSCSLVSDSLWPCGLQHARLPCVSPTFRACSKSCPSSWWCQPTISSSVIPFSSCLQSSPASGCLPMSQFFTSDSHSIGISASTSVLPMNISVLILSINYYNILRNIHSVNKTQITHMYTISLNHFQALNQN